MLQCDCLKLELLEELDTCYKNNKGILGVKKIIKYIETKDSESWFQTEELSNQSVGNMVLNQCKNVWPIAALSVFGFVCFSRQGWQL